MVQATWKSPSKAGNVEAYVGIAGVLVMLDSGWMFGPTKTGATKEPDGEDG